MEENINKNPSVDNPNNQQTYEKQPKIEITVKRHQQLFELLKDPNKLWRALASLFLVIIILFIGLAFVVLSIKKFYPYNMIETNIQGASIVKSEDKDVIYWLFNTADLWANSGIEVQKGDILTIRASGSSFTAFHHLVDASIENREPHDKWVGTEGQELDKDNRRDVIRSQFRLCKDVPEGILLMKIISTDCSQKELKGWTHDELTKDIEVIGKERTLYISKPGILHFAVNDIVLTDTIIKKMYKNYVDSIYRIMSLKKDSIDSLVTKLDSINADNSNSVNYFNKFISSIKGINNKNDSLWKNRIFEQTGLALGHYPVINGDSTYYKSYPLVNELVYYKRYGFLNAWYMDNLGSFLIVIERKHK